MDKELLELLNAARANGANESQMQGIVDSYNQKKKNGLNSGGGKQTEVLEEPLSTLEVGSNGQLTQSVPTTLQSQESDTPLSTFDPTANLQSPSPVVANIGNKLVNLEATAPKIVSDRKAYAETLKQKIQEKVPLSPIEYEQVKQATGFDDDLTSLALSGDDRFQSVKTLKDLDSKKNNIVDYLRVQDEAKKNLGQSNIQGGLFDNYDLDDEENVNSLFNRFEADKKRFEDASTGINPLDATQRQSAQQARENLNKDSPFMQQYTKLKDWKAYQIASKMVSEDNTDAKSVGMAIQRQTDKEQHDKFIKSHGVSFTGVPLVDAAKVLFHKDTPLQDYQLEDLGANYIKEALGVEIAKKNIIGEDNQKEITEFIKVDETQSNLYNKYPDVRYGELVKTISNAKASEEGLTLDSENNGVLSRIGYETTADDVVRLAKENGIYNTQLDKELVDKIAGEQNLNPIMRIFLPGYALLKKSTAPIENVSLSGQFVEGTRGVIESTGKSIIDLIQLRGNGTISAEQYNDDVIESWKKDQSNLDETQKNIALVGSTTGQIVGQALTTLAFSGIGKAASLSQGAIENLGFWASGALSSYDGGKKAMLNITNSEAKAEAGGLLIGFFNAVTEKMFKDTKVFGDVFNKRLGNILNNIDEGKLYTQATRNAIVKGLQSDVPRWGKNFVKEGQKEGFEEFSTAVLQDGTEAVFGDNQKFDITKTWENARDTYVSTLIGGSLAAGKAAHTNITINPNAATSLHHAAQNPNFYISSIQELKNKNEISEQEANKKIQLVNTAVVINNEISQLDTGLNDRQKSAYISYRTTQSQLQSMYDNTTDETIKSTLDAKIKLLDEQKNKILNGLQFDEKLQPLDKLYDQEQNYLKAKKVAEETGTPEAIAALETAKSEYADNVATYYKTAQPTPLSEPIEGLDEQGVPIQTEVVETEIKQEPIQEGSGIVTLPPQSFPEPTVIGGEQQETVTPEVVPTVSEPSTDALKDVESTKNALENNKEALNKILEKNPKLTIDEIANAYHYYKSRNEQIEFTNLIEQSLSEPKPTVSEPSVKEVEYNGKTYRVKEDGSIVELENGKEFKADLTTITRKEISDLATTVSEPSTEVKSEVGKALEKFDTEDNFTIDDLVNRVEEISNESGNKELSDAVDTYRKEQEYDRSVSGRGDIDAAQKVFEDVVNKYKAETNKVEGKVSVSSSDYSKLPRAELLQKIIDSNDNTELQSLQKELQRRKKEGEPKSENKPIQNKPSTEVKSEVVIDRQETPINIDNIGEGFVLHRGSKMEGPNGFNSLDRSSAEGYADKEGVVTSSVIKKGAKVLKLVSGDTENYTDNEAGINEFYKIIGEKERQKESEWAEGENPSDMTTRLWNNKSAVDKLKKAGVDIVIGGTIDGPDAFIVNEKAVEKVTPKQKLNEQTKVTEDTKQAAKEVNADEGLTEVSNQAENIEKAKELLKGTVAGAAFQGMNEDESIKFIADQAQNVQSDGSISTLQSSEAAYNAAVRTFTKPLVDAAISVYPTTAKVTEPIPTKEQGQEKQGTKTTIPESVEPVSPTTTTSAVAVPVTKSFSTKARDLAAKIRKDGITPDFLKISDPNVKISGISDKQVSEALANAIEFVADAVDAGTDLAKAISDGFNEFKKVYTDNNEPFNEEKVKSGFTSYVGGQLGTGISNARTEEIREKYKLGGYVRNNATNLELESLADEAIKNGYNIEDLLQQLENLIPPTGVENFILKKYISGLEATFENNPIESNLVPIERVVKALDKIGSVQSEAFRTRGGIVPVDDSLAGYFITEKELNLGATLTEKQKGTVKKEYEGISHAQKEWDKEKERLNAKIIELQAQTELNKGKASKKEPPKTTPKKHEDFVSQRQKLKDKLKQQVADYKAVGQKLGITSDGGVESFIITAKMARTISEIVKSHVDEIGTKLAEVTKRTFDDIKDLFEGITEKDIHNVIAGNYAEPRPTKNELSQKLFDLKTEAALVNKLDTLLKGEEPKTEKKKIERNKEITALRNKIKDFERAKISAANEIKKVAAEEERLIREFEREQEKEAKAKLKAEAQRQKEILRELEKKTPEEIALQGYKTRTKNQIKQIEQDLKDGNFDTPVKKPAITLDKEALDAKDKLVKLKAERHLRILKQQQENMSAREKAIKGAAEILNIPRTLMTIVDYSAVLRQGLIQTISHPQFVLNARVEDGRIKVGGAGVDMIKAGVSQRVYDRWFFDLKETPRFNLMEESGLGITDSTNPLLSAREEGFMSNLAERIPLIGKTLNIGKVKIPGTNLVKGSERSYSMFINKLRVDVFNRFADAMEERGLTFENSPEAYKQMAEYVNNSTGRGSLGKTLNRIAPLLNGIFFSPRLIASRLNMLTYLAQPRFYTTVPKEVRAAYFKDMAKFIGVGMTVLALFSLNDGGGDEEDDVIVENDPRSSDFGKIRQGNTRWDIWGGFQPFIRVAAQLLTGERKSTNSGKIFELSGEDAFGKTKADVLFAFGRGKLAPVPGMAIDLFSGRTAIGEKVLFDKFGKANEGDKEITIDRYLKEHLLPLTYTGVEEAIKDKGIKSLFTVGIPSVFGVGTQTYTPSIGKGQTITVYKNGKKRDSTPEEFKKYEVEKDATKTKLLERYKKSGVYINKYGEVTTEETRKKRKYETLTEEERSDLDGSISRKASYLAKKKLNLNDK